MIINTNTTKLKSHLQEKEDKKNDSKKPLILLIICIALIALIITYQVVKNYYNNYNYLKVDRGEFIVYTRFNQNKKEVPYINIKSDSAENVNNDILDFCNQYVQIDNLVMTYEYNINGNYLSVLIKILNNSEEVPEFIFRAYNMNLKTREYVDGKALLEYYNISEDIVSAKIHNKFVDMYQEEIQEEYLVEEACSFDCYMLNRGVEDYLENVFYYIKDSKLYAIKPFNHISIYAEEEYFTEESFQFQISE